MCETLKIAGGSLLDISSFLNLPIFGKESNFNDYVVEVFNSFRHGEYTIRSNAPRNSFPCPVEFLLEALGRSKFALNWLVKKYHPLPTEDDRKHAVTMLRALEHLRSNRREYGLVFDITTLLARNGEK